MPPVVEVVFKKKTDDSNTGHVTLFGSKEV
jgi:hypothetical protein